MQADTLANGKVLMLLVDSWWKYYCKSKVCEHENRIEATLLILNIAVKQ